MLESDAQAPKPKRGPRKTTPSPQLTKISLTDKQDRFVEARLQGATQTVAAVVAGYSPASAHVAGSQIAARPEVRAAIEERRPQYMRAAGIDPAKYWARMAQYADDDDAKVRSSSVRATELILKGAKELDSDVNVSVDARSLLLPQGLALDPAAFDSLAAQLLAASALPTDGGTDAPAGG